MSRFRWRLSLVQEFSLDDQLAEEQWDYLNWNVHPTHGPRLRKGTVLFIKHTDRRLGWRPRERPRWRTLRTSWRTK